MAAGEPDDARCRLMKNTGIIYSSTERTPIMLPELAGLLPPLSEQLGAQNGPLKMGAHTLHHRQ